MSAKGSGVHASTETNTSSDSIHHGRSLQYASCASQASLSGSDNVKCTYRHRVPPTPPWVQAQIPRHDAGRNDVVLHILSCTVSPHSLTD